jgi:hypothetical protein
MILALKEPSNYLKHSNQTHLSLLSISMVTKFLHHFILTHAGNDITGEGAVNLSAVLKSNSSLTELEIGCTGLTSFHF